MNGARTESSIREVQNASESANHHRQLACSLRPAMIGRLSVRADRLLGY